MWNFTDLRGHLLPLAETVLGDVDKIILARELGIREWLVPAYVELCQRPEPLNIEEATKLGMQGFWMISNMREQFRPPKAPTSSGQQVQRHYCSNCIGTSYHGNSYKCAGCQNYAAYFTCYNQAGILGRDEVETQVKKWIEANCATKGA